MHVGLQSGKSAVELAAEGNSGRGHSEVLKVLCEHGAPGALCYAAKNDLRDILAELISKGHDLEECDQVLVYEALSCPFSPLPQCFQIQFYSGSIQALFRLH